MRLEVGSRSDVGRVREFNEDSIGVYRPTDAQERARKGELFLVADGMGGHASGEIASRLAVDSVLRSFGTWTGDDVAAILVAAVQQANAEIFAHGGGQDGLARMGTTCVGALLRGSELHVVNVGDSRAYRVRAGQIEQLSRDHSLVAMEVEKGLIDAEKARHLSYRSTITRALGPKPSVEVDHFQHTLQIGDVIVLCTDGLSGQVQDAEIAAAVSRYSPDEAVSRLVDLANQRGGPDNISVIVVRVRPDTLPVQAATPAPRAAAKPAWQRYLRRVLHAWPFVLVALAAMLFIALLAIAVLTTGFRARATPSASPAVRSPGATGTGAPLAVPEPPVSAPPLPNAAPLVQQLQVPLEVPLNVQQKNSLAQELGYKDAAEMIEASGGIPLLGKPLMVWPSSRRKAIMVVGAVHGKAPDSTCEFQVVMGERTYSVACPATGGQFNSAQVREGGLARVLGLIGKTEDDVQAIAIDTTQPRAGGSAAEWVNWYQDSGAERRLWVYTVASGYTIGDMSPYGLREGDYLLVYIERKMDWAQIAALIRLVKLQDNRYTLAH